MFVPAMVGEYLGVRLNFAEVADLGGASSVGMVWRAAAAIELGLANTVLCVIPSRLAPVAENDKLERQAYAHTHRCGDGDPRGLRRGVFGSRPVPHRRWRQRTSRSTGCN
ncbi:hypothetical protein WKW80_33970 [Variovorax humicola]|uniref:Uncharacterized protein n=1 Tax=Variovorax humicola TaxID=1769758 RepID=A0ABU8WAI0_9BURK